jgi:hypothetical protein
LIRGKATSRSCSRRAARSPEFCADLSANTVGALPRPTARSAALHTDVGPYLKPGDDVGYLGDLDLAGDDIEANTRRVLEKIVGGKLNWKRLALTPEQVTQYRLPSITKTDQRFKNGGGVHEAVETEALSQTLIVDIVRNWLDSRLPQSLDRVHVREQQQRARLRRLVEPYTRRGAS